jgi:hypothetical protein
VPVRRRAWCCIKWRTSSQGCHNAFFSARLPAETQLHAARPDVTTHGCMHHKSLPGIGQTGRLPELQVVARVYMRGQRT